MRARILVLTSLAMLAFAGNSLLCRIALGQAHIDTASFTSIRILSGAVALWLLPKLRPQPPMPSGNWLSAMALFAYAAAFSFAYVGLSAGTGALLLFGSVQATMILAGIRKGERLGGWQGIGLLLALCGLVALLLPGLSAPPLRSAILMVGAGAAWGAYSLLGKGSGDPTAVTSGNFLRAVPFALILSLVMSASTRLDAAGIGYAIASGALTSGVGYAIWYAVLPALRASSAATVQLCVPVIAAGGGVMFLGEPVSLRLLGASVAVLGGIALVVLRPRPAT